ncbi:MAG: 1-deoxy-D-xylulose-5-phosphate reductoisomerase [Planctomycetota bacterium]
MGIKRVLLLGATGSIGRNTLRVLRELRDTHVLVGATAWSNAAALGEVAHEFQLRHVAIAGGAAERLAAAIPGVTVHDGERGLVEIVTACEPDLVVSGVTGAAGLPAAVEAVRLGIALAIANKEPLVMAGPLILELARRSGARLLPVDSEHSAIFQAIEGHDRSHIRRLFLTASGGPFRGKSAAELRHVTRDQALRHPTWQMGAKITIDSATLMNKALEVVEAHWLFQQPPEAIEVLVHPQSIVHSMVEFGDGSILAQLGVPDMTVPIRYALTYPDRGRTADTFFNLERFRSLTFEAPDTVAFPALALGYQAARLGGTAGAILNAANEVAVERFLAGDLPFHCIAPAVAAVLETVPIKQSPALDDVLEADRLARKEALRCLTVLSS